MKFTSSPARIGLFVLIGIILAVGTIIYVGSTRLWEKDQTFLIFFRESVNGLTVGSPVKFKGVPIGTVSDIRLSYNQKDTVEGFYIPVFLRIRGKLVRSRDRDVSHVDLSDWEEVKEQIRSGLRGRLELESIITGQLFVELDYFAKPGASFRLVQDEINYLEIPSTPSVMAELGSSAADVLAQLGAVDVRTISEELIELLQKANASLDELDLATWNASIEGVGQSLQSALNELELQPTLDRLNGVLDNLSGVTAELDENMPAAIAEFRAVANELSEAVARSKGAIANVENLTAPDAALQQELLETFRDLRRAARSARELMNYLERNPRALLSGREDIP